MTCMANFVRNILRRSYLQLQLCKSISLVWESTCLKEASSGFFQRVNNKTIADFGLIGAPHLVNELAVSNWLRYSVFKSRLIQHRYYKKIYLRDLHSLWSDTVHFKCFLRDYRNWTLILHTTICVQTCQLPSQYEHS